MLSELGISKKRQKIFGREIYAEKQVLFKIRIKIGAKTFFMLRKGNHNNRTKDKNLEKQAILQRVRCETVTGF